MTKVTQTTIARKHGVSRQAVGYALGLYTNSNIKLSPETKDGIIRTAKELGYRPNRLAQIISGRRSGMIGVLNFGGITQMSAQNSLSMAREIQKSGYQLMLQDVTWYQKDTMDHVITAMLDQRVEGLVLICPTDWLPARTLELIKQSKIPVISVGGALLEGIPHVEGDYEKETYELVHGLLDADYQSFVFLAPWFNPRHDESGGRFQFKRMRGFSRAIEERGGQVRDVPLAEPARTPVGEWFFTPVVTDWTDPYSTAYQGAHQILARKNLLPDIILCLNDDWAAGALRACGEKGVRVPEDIALAGYDGTIISNYGFVPLTTIVQATSTLASKAIEILQTLIKKEPLPEDGMVVQIPGKIEWRASSRRPPAAKKH